jgi:hypothetical protein
VPVPVPCRTLYSSSLHLWGYFAARLSLLGSGCARRDDVLVRETLISYNTYWHMNFKDTPITITATITQLQWQQRRNSRPKTGRRGYKQRVYRPTTSVGLPTPALPWQFQIYHGS